MRKSLVSSLAMLSILLLITATYNPASATTYAVGIKLGDTADYATSIAAFAYKNVTSLHVYVYGVVGTAVVLNVTKIYKNGTQAKPFQIVGDVSSGIGFLFSLWFLTAKNLTTNDPVYSGQPYKINGTKQMNVAGASRTVSYLNMSMAVFIGTLHWDRATGILAKADYVSWGTGTVKMNLTSTSLWSGGLFGLDTTTLLIIGAVGVVLIAVIALALRRRK